MKTGDKYSAEFTVDRSVRDKFIAISGDANPLHTSDKFAVSKGFEAALMHGNILNCFISRLVGEMLPTREVMLLSQEIKFLHPVYMGTTLILKAEITDSFDFIPGLEISFLFQDKATSTKKAKGKVLIKLI